MCSERLQWYSFAGIYKEMVYLSLGVHHQYLSILELEYKKIHTQNTASAPSHPIQHPTAGASTHMTPVGLVMAGCCQIDYILTTMGRRNSIRILDQHPLFWNISIWTQFICLIKLFAF